MKGTAMILAGVRKSLFLVAALLCLRPSVQGVTAGRTAFFETKVLPVLQQRCFECHSHAKKLKGGLALDSRGGWLTGGDHG